MKAAAHLSKIKIMVDSDVVIINRPHGCLLVASAELGLHVTHRRETGEFLISRNSLLSNMNGGNVQGCSLDSIFNTQLLGSCEVFCNYPYKP